MATTNRQATGRRATARRASTRRAASRRATDRATDRRAGDRAAGRRGADRSGVVRALLREQGTTYAEQAGIALADRPGPLYQLLVLTTLLSVPSSSSVGVAGARALFAAGYRAPRAMLRASWQDRVDALGRGHYRRYDERTATMLGEGAQLLLDRWKGDLRRLRDEAGGDTPRIRALLMRFPGIGPTGSDIFLREVQAVWPPVAPYLDERVIRGAARVRLPQDPRQLAGLARSRQELAHLAAALIRVSRRGRAAQEVVASAGQQ